MKTALVVEWLTNFGTDIHLFEETTDYEVISLKMGTLSGTMKCTETQFLSIPYRGRVFNREVLITVQGRQSLCLRCNITRAMCPETEEKRRTYAQMARLEPNETEVRPQYLQRRKVWKSYADSARAGLEDGSGESAQLSADVPRTDSSEGSPVQSQLLTTSCGKGTQPCADVHSSSEGPPQDRVT
ncbi:unnamed protein product [Mytilus edulis]|uniref:Uncharacterized protein n=1 Tax=Mytilus edulis TaxID=6550 RepID=A0A8S3UGY8_MYTED|nr:unnamed protein product [Mytilus edulis]